MGYRISDGRESAFGGGAFCVDGDSVLYVSPDRKSLSLNGKALCSTDSTFAAPWLCGRWFSVLSRDGQHIVGCNGDARYFPHEWYHSCLQVIPLISGALVIGFTGRFPIETNMMGCLVSDDMEFGEPFIIDQCNVNDRLTFHFQAVAHEGTVSIVYLGSGLSVREAVYNSNIWTLRTVDDHPSFAPQNISTPSGVKIIWCTYDGHVRTENGDPICSGPNISPSFALTGYGTGGIIAPARWLNANNIPFLMATITDESNARARLELKWTLDEPEFDYLDTNAQLARWPGDIVKTYRRMV